MTARLLSTSDALVEVSDHILNTIDSLSKVEYNKKGRKYRFVNNQFQRIRQEDKYLIINPENLDDNLGLLSAFNILSNINNGEILDQFPEFCVTILGMAQVLERKKWYEEENHCVLHIKNAKYDPRELAQIADEYILDHPITDQHIEWGVNLMIASKLNFFHTDHHIGTKLEGLYMRQFIEEYFGEDALNSHDVLIALKSCVHWGNIKGILYKLEVPNLSLSQDIIENFASFPDPLPELKMNIYERYPSGTSKYSLIRKAIDLLCDWKYSKLVDIPPQIDFEWIFELCHDIESDPIKYHLRSSTKQLCDNPVNLQELNVKYNARIKQLLNLISTIINIFPETGGEFLLQNSKIPKFTPDLISEEYCAKLIKLQEQIESYEDKEWDVEDIVLRLYTGDLENSLFERVMKMREKFSDDYE
ncbi:uncharacterized protein J8A68_005871 [[Candida] subhashii]|uniref:Uncharacterized protein n=1 Tax=[Candida] subhashii TaxID=561895 RepID=A0A8J5USF1_9ASCO|nr:uncharacterized protein J8A68_005871 [[Candida] subhashii]KAG7660605.1 hypothetical protein J8A68_005871 [[Candida] subhashii]